MGKIKSKHDISRKLKIMFDFLLETFFLSMIVKCYLFQPFFFLCIFKLFFLILFFFVHTLIIHLFFPVSFQSNKYIVYAVIRCLVWSKQNAMYHLKPVNQFTAEMKNVDFQFLRGANSVFCFNFCFFFQLFKFNRRFHFKLTCTICTAKQNIVNNE